MRHLLPVFTSSFQDQTLPHSLLCFSISHPAIPSLRIYPFFPETLVLDVGKHTFNYPWPHISLKYMHCTTPWGDTVHAVSPDLFMGNHLGRDLLPLTVICVHFVVKSWKSFFVMFAARHGCQIEVFSSKDMACLCGLDVPAVGFFQFYQRTHAQNGKQWL